MTDLLSSHEPPVTKAERIKCVEREIKMRERVYPRWVEVKRMKQSEADHELRVMRSVLEIVRNAL